jgi:hypothetical protein
LNNVLPLESGSAMNRFETRLAKLEGNAPAPASPFDGLTIDELTVWILEQCSELLAGNDLQAEVRADVEKERARVCWRIIETVNFASGRWAKPRGFDNYQERITSMKRYWERLQSERGEYVPSLIESDGGGPDPVTPDLMARRAKCWAHPIVKQIVKDAPAAKIQEKSLFHECGSFKSGHPGKPSDSCAQMCKRECLNSRRGGFKALDRSTPDRYH